MTGRQKLLDAVNALEAAFAQGAKLGDNNFSEHRKEVIQLRRLIAAQTSSIGPLCEEAFEQAEEQQAFRSEFSKMRSAMALHQASWPVVSIDFENPDYLSSLRSMQEAHRKFVAWARIALAAS